MSVLEAIQGDARAALKAGERELVGTLRVLASELQKAEKDGGADPVAVLQRERKRRLEAAAAYEEAGREDLAGAERREAAVIERYLPAQLSDEELEEHVADAVAAVGATSIRDMGRVMAAAMERVAGRADGRRVSQAVKEKLSA